MANAYTLSEVQAFIPGKTWDVLPAEMQASATVYLNAQQDQPNAEQLLGYWLIVPPFRADELVALVVGHNQELVAMPLISGVLVLSLGAVTDLDPLGYGYAHEFLSGLEIRFADESDFPADTSGV